MGEQNQQPNKPITESGEQDTPFYNVMPKTETRGPLVTQQLHVSEDLSPDNGPRGAVMGFIKQHKAIAIGILAILVLAYPAYFALDKFVLSKSDEQNLLSEEALKKLQGDADKASEGPKELPYKTPQDWQARFFGSDACQNLDQCGDEADPDRDGLKNLKEFKKESDPNNSDSDQDGLSDGDEVYVFGSKPGDARTAGDPLYNDGQYITGGYNPMNKDASFSAEEIANLSAKMKEFGLHQPTITTLGDSLLKLYKFSASGEQPQSATSTPPAPANNPLEGIDESPESRQDRDTQRSNTIKNVAIALVRFYEDKKSYPATSDFSQMFNSVKLYAKVATNPQDPINKDKYVYTYSPSSADGQDFILTFFSETQNQIIRTRGADAKKYQQQEQAALYDDQRTNNLKSLQTALLLYSNNQAGGNQEYVFPTMEDYQTALVPEFITEIPKDPKTHESYEYQVSEAFDSFTLKAVLDAPASGKTGYLCNQEECRYY